MWMRLATGHKRMQPTNPLLWRHQATGDPSKDLQQGVPAAKRFCLWFQVSWSFFCFVLFDWFFNWCLYPPDGYSYRESEHHLKLNVLIAILVEWGILFFWAMLHIFAFFCFFFRVFVFKPMVLREGADPIHVVSAWSQDLKFRVGNSCPTIK